MPRAARVVARTPSMPSDRTVDSLRASTPLRAARCARGSTLRASPWPRYLLASHFAFVLVAFGRPSPPFANARGSSAHVRMIACDACSHVRTSRMFVCSLFCELATADASTRRLKPRSGQNPTALSAPRAGRLRTGQPRPRGGNRVMTGYHSRFTGVTPKGGRYVPVESYPTCKSVVRKAGATQGGNDERDGSIKSSDEKVIRKASRLERNLTETLLRSLDRPHRFRREARPALASPRPRTTFCVTDLRNYGLYYGLRDPTRPA